MNTIQPYISDADKEEYRRFVSHHLPAFGRPLGNEVWHYTTAASLISILSEGKLFSTQISCLNDSLEQRFFGDLVHAGIKTLLASNKDPIVDVLAKTADFVLSNRDFSSTWHFVTCFSEVADDLGQWRGYGGGQCGYAIGFDPSRLVANLNRTRPGSIFIPMNYDAVRQQFLVDDVIKNAQTFFAARAAGRDVQRWANEFLEAFAWELDVFACMTKHPSFQSEKERRIVTPLGIGEAKNLEFRQKQTLLARHLPIDLRGDDDLLPITSICIGPGPAQRVTQISVGDLLLKYGYAGIPVTLSAVPFRIP